METHIMKRALAPFVTTAALAALGAAAPADCPENQSALVDDAGTAIKCATPPPND